MQVQYRIIYNIMGNWTIAFHFQGGDRDSGRGYRYYMNKILKLLAVRSPWLTAHSDPPVSINIIPPGPPGVPLIPLVPSGPMATAFLSPLVLLLLSLT